MEKLITPRFALPVIVILAIATIAFIALAVVVNGYNGTAFIPPCC